MSSGGKISREEIRRQKDLDAARKAGTAPAEVDEDGREINPHIPEFMAKAPWYLDTGKPSLKHQRKTADERVGMDKWYQRGARESQTASKYRKGACENCGAMSHKTKDCLERPRKRGAKWSNKDIAADEIITDVSGIEKDYDAKRDRWNGYDPSEHVVVMKQYEALEEARRKKREQELDKLGEGSSGAGSKKAKRTRANDDEFGNSDSDGDEDEDDQTPLAEAGQVRNLRIREDRAKYLYNLDVDSAYYDPKSRSMREAPNPDVRPEDAQYAGDNFERSQGDVKRVQELQSFAWQGVGSGSEFNMQANPTINELQHRQHQEKKQVQSEKVKQSLIDRYGGEEHLQTDSVPRAGQTEVYTEYTPDGKPMQKTLRRPQAVMQALRPGQHSSEFGSWTDAMTGAAGYECCHSTLKNSYCTGEAGKEAQQASMEMKTNGPVKQQESEHESESSSGDSDDSSSSDGNTRKASAITGFVDQSNLGQGAVDKRLDKGKLKEALQQNDESSKPDWLKDAEAINARVREKYPSLVTTNAGSSNAFDVSEEQLEAYRIKNRRGTGTDVEDPMANYRDEDE